MVSLAASTVVLWVANNTYRRVRVEQELAIQYSLGALDQITRSLADGTDTGFRSREATERVVPVAIQYFDRMSGMFSKDDRLQEVVAQAHWQAGFCRMKLGSPRACDDYRQAICGFEGLAARFPDRIWFRTHLIETLREYAGQLKRPRTRRRPTHRFAGRLRLPRA